jgi:hypothetical protein
VYVFAFFRVGCLGSIEMRRLHGMTGVEMVYDVEIRVETLRRVGWGWSNVVKSVNEGDEYVE